MHRAALPHEMRAELFKNAIRLHKNSPKSIGLLRVIGRVRFILIERDRIRYFVRFAVDGHREVETRHFIHESLVERRHRLRFEPETPKLPIAGPNRQLMADKVEFDFELTIAIRNRGGAKSPG